jgi:hypothetical protein
MPDGGFGGGIADHIELVARGILGEPNRALSTSTQWRFGNHGSLAVEIGGEKKGTWFDHEAGDGGGVLDLVQRRLRLDREGAIQWLSRETGWRPYAPARPTPFGIPSSPAEPCRQVGETAAAEPGPGKRIVATYDYFDADGALAFQVVRYEPKDFRQRRPDGRAAGSGARRGCGCCPIGCRTSSTPSRLIRSSSWRARRTLTRSAPSTWLPPAIRAAPRS